MKLEKCPKCGKKGVCLTHDYLETFRHCRYCGAAWWPAAWKEAMAVKEVVNGKH
jgi:uncharacterized protein (DUF983 family)